MFETITGVVFTWGSYAACRHLSDRGRWASHSTQGCECFSRSLCAACWTVKWRPRSRHGNGKISISHICTFGYRKNLHGAASHQRVCVPFGHYYHTTHKNVPLLNILSYLPCSQISSLDIIHMLSLCFCQFRPQDVRLELAEWAVIKPTGVQSHHPSFISLSWIMR